MLAIFQIHRSIFQRELQVRQIPCSSISEARLKCNQFAVELAQMGTLSGINVSDGYCSVVYNGLAYSCRALYDKRTNVVSIENTNYISLD